MLEVDDTTVKLKPIENMIPVIVYNVVATFSFIANEGNKYDNRHVISNETI